LSSAAVAGGNRTLDQIAVAEITIRWRKPAHFMKARGSDPQFGGLSGVVESAIRDCVFTRFGCFLALAIMTSLRPSENKVTWQTLDWSDKRKPALNGDADVDHPRAAATRRDKWRGEGVRPSYWRNTRRYPSEGTTLSR
jgi:hypothetical protein